MPDAWTLVRIQNNGREDVIRTVPKDALTDEQVLRAQALAESRSLKSQFPARRYVVYGPSDSPTLDVDDRIWDSAVAYGLPDL
jgi:hypothetical protein